MNISQIRSVATAVAFLSALTACGGQGMVPSQSASGFNAMNPMSTNPCYTKAVQPAWIFDKGSCVMTTLPAKGKKIKLAPYRGVTVTIALPKNNSKGNPSFVLVDAMGGKAKDIKPFKKRAFPAIPKSSGKSVVYVEAVNGFNGLLFKSGYLVLSVTAKLPGTKCSMALLQSSGKWFTIPLQPTVSGNTIAEKIPAGAVKTLFGNGLPAGPLYFNAACK